MIFRIHGVKKINFHSCNVLRLQGDGAVLWPFSLAGSQQKLGPEVRVAPGQMMPPQVGARDWRTLFQKRLNVAWLPSDQVFLRVVHLPAADAAELGPMVEFQLERLSPIPTNQIVWSYEVLRGAAPGQQTVLVVIAARAAVEEFTKRLEEGRFLPDRLELPQVHQLAAATVDGDAIWLMPHRNGQSEAGMCLIAWWVQGILQQVQLVHFTRLDQAPALLVEHLNNAAWAGEIEGWLSGAARWRLIAEPELAAGWKPVLDAAAPEPVEVVAPAAETTLAELTARRSAQGDSRVNLLPAEFSARYRQQFIDRLWMSGLGAVIGAYVVGVLIYFAILLFLSWQKDRILQEVKQTSGSYTNAIKLREKVDVLQNQVDLKYAALDAFKVVSEALPADLVLTSFALTRGQKLIVSGTAPTSQKDTLTTYAKDLREATVAGSPVFSKVPIPRWQSLPGRGGAAEAQISWTLECELKRSVSE